MTSLISTVIDALRSVALVFLGQQDGVKDRVAVRVPVEQQRRNPLNLR